MFNVNRYGIIIKNELEEFLVEAWECKQGDFIEVNKSFDQKYNYILKHRRYFIEFNMTSSLKIISTGILL